MWNQNWYIINSDTSRSFPKPTTSRIGVKVISQFGDKGNKDCSVY